MKKNLLVVMSSSAKTGPGNVVETLLRNRSKLGVEKISIMFISKNEGESFEIPDGVTMTELDLPHGKISSEIRKTIAEEIINNSIDIIYSHGIRADGIVSRLKVSDKIVKVSTSHNNPFIDYILQYGLKGFVMAVMQIFYFNKFDWVVTLNPVLTRLHKVLVPFAKIVMIPNGTRDIPNLAVEDVPVSYGVVATFNKRKNQQEVLETNEENSFDRKMVLYGDGPLLNKLKMRYESKNTSFKGFSSDTNTIYSSFSILISMSKSEGLPLNVIEAMSYGKILILSNIPAHRFLVEGLASESYRLVRNKSELVAAMRHFSNQEKILKEQQLQIIRHFEQNFTDEQMAKKYADIFAK